MKGGNFSLSAISSLLLFLTFYDESRVVLSGSVRGAVDAVDENCLRRVVCLMGGPVQTDVLVAVSEDAFAALRVELGPRASVLSPVTSPSLLT